MPLWLDSLISEVKLIVIIFACNWSSCSSVWFTMSAFFFNFRFCTVSLGSWHLLHLSSFSRCKGLALLVMQDMFCSFFGIIGYVRFLVDIECDQLSTRVILLQWRITFFFVLTLCRVVFRDPSKGLFCYAQGYTTHFFCVASFLWTTTIAFTLHRTVVRHKTDVEDLEPMFHLYVWGNVLLVT